MQTLTVATIAKIEAFRLDKDSEPPKRWLTSKPVFLVSMTSGNGSDLVLKAESIFGKTKVEVEYSVRWGSKMMKQVSPAVHVHDLTWDEVQALKALGNDKFADPKSGAYLKYLLGLKECTLFKMDLVQQLTDVQTMIDSENGLLALRALRSAAVLKGLGRIVAVDLFLGNFDRFRADGAIKNAGNIFLREIDQGYESIGLDFFNYIAKAANLCVSPPLEEEGTGSSDFAWQGRRLLNELSLYAYAWRAIDSLNAHFRTELGRTNTAYQNGDLLSQEDFNELYRGLVEGAAVLKSYLERKSLVVVPGIAKRMQLLGWKTQ
jgi:hypothetical protein